MSRNCDVSLQLLYYICLTIYYRGKRIKIVQKNTRSGNQQQWQRIPERLTPLLDHL